MASFFLLLLASEDAEAVAAAKSKAYLAAGFGEQPGEITFFSFFEVGINFHFSSLQRPRKILLSAAQRISSVSFFFYLRRTYQVDLSYL